MAELVSVLVALLGAYLAYRLGLAAYFRQKEFENVRTRYLDNGVELTCSHVDYALGIFRNNWTLMLRSLKQYRDIEGHVQFDDFLAQLREVDQGYFQIAPIYKIRALVGSHIFWVAYQKVFAFVGTSNDFIKANYAPALKAMIERPGDPRKDAFIEDAQNKALELEKKTEIYYSVLAELQTLAEILEKENLTRQAIATFHERKDVMELVARVERLFPSEQDK